VNQPQERLKDLAVNDSGFVFDPYSGATFSTNAAGLKILAALKDGEPRANIATMLRDTFEVIEGENDIDRDIDEFVQLLKRNYVVDSDFTLE